MTHSLEGAAVYGIAASLEDEGQFATQKNVIFCRGVLKGLTSFGLSDGR